MNGRQDAGAAVAGLFAGSATDGLAGASLNGADDHAVEASHPAPRRARTQRSTSSVQAESRVRLGVELTEDQIVFLRSLSRPARTGQPRTLGSKFVGTGVLIAAIELLAASGVDMDGVAAGDLDEMVARARAALLKVGERNKETNA